MPQDRDDVGARERYDAELAERLARLLIAEFRKRQVRGAEEEKAARPGAVDDHEAA